MTYAAIMVHAEAGDVADARLRFAVDLANQFNARLIGVGADTGVAAFASASAEATRSPVEAIDAGVCAARARFLPIASHVTAGREWREVGGDPAAALVREARAADLVVVGPAQETDGGPRLHADPADVLMGSGRPILIAPPSQTRFSLCRAVVGWKDTRESRRALLDALPLLARASRVKVVEICDQGARAQAQARLDDVAAYLGRHGVPAETEVAVGADEATGVALRDICSDWEADLLVVGGHGRSRTREWVFGGVTRELLHDSPTPVLLSH